MSTLAGKDSLAWSIPPVWFRRLIGAAPFGRRVLVPRRKPGWKGPPGQDRRTSMGGLVSLEAASAIFRDSPFEIRGVCFWARSSSAMTLGRLVAVCVIGDFGAQFPSPGSGLMWL